MPTVAILGFDDSYASVIGGFADMLQVANAHMSKQGMPVAGLFEWHFLSPNGLSVRASNGLELAMRPLPKNRYYDLVFIPSLYYRGWQSFQRFLDSQVTVRDWLIRQWRHGAWLCANCTGTFLLADTGLLDNKIATTTWWLEGHFRARFPLVDLQMRPLVTESERLVCGGAHATFLLQAVHILGVFAGKAIAMQCARSMLVDLTQTTQTPLQPLIADKTHNDPLVQRAQKWLQDHLAEQVRMTDLAQKLAVSERTLICRFNMVLEQSPLTYLQSLRIDTARALLEAGDLSTEQIAQYVGYSDVSSFSRLFRERVGFTPGAYRARFQLPESNELK
ncbi:GlxA family transcriptional regulator [Pseudomonas aeruginosa]|uniref:GlxA family transcriptional regulator n=1 Tax=Pseudomonas aeruginosa TaxID=287 RepID=UPI0007179A13|nr:helix-turn-helix domain-containing protein [Pseudomonas aeruginosa]KRV32168.1 transcriptional regulator [Pseudomonas aeruginosa]KSF44338.1 transcriptional regulator [Pseudomonas aeruginosa]MCT5235671.1 helix-turn-helix domain-containing protein [Pseudomonas aeruginosa]MCV6434598.1 helix-turn-helix domain-containing protein [Pseudomonas aeruginosa]MCV6442211.1 helix-turn-helix domain-containing protein [Pseudomonas aeruginosa]